MVADSKYGTIDNFLACYDLSIAVHIPDLKQYTVKRTESRGIFPGTLFAYDAASDTYRFPAGQLLKRKSFHANRNSIDYAVPKKTCDACAKRRQCTHNKMGRSIKRHLRQAELDGMRRQSCAYQTKRDLRTRKHLMERSFARASRYGFDRVRWRGRSRVTIQEYLTVAIQNIEVLLRYRGDPRRRAARAMKETGETIKQKAVNLREYFFCWRPWPDTFTRTATCLA